MTTTLQLTISLFTSERTGSYTSTTSGRTLKHAKYAHTHTPLTRSTDPLSSSDEYVFCYGGTGSNRRDAAGD